MKNSRKTEKPGEKSQKTTKIRSWDVPRRCLGVVLGALGVLLGAPRRLLDAPGELLEILRGLCGAL